MAQYGTASCLEWYTGICVDSATYKHSLTLLFTPNDNSSSHHHFVEELELLDGKSSLLPFLLHLLALFSSSML